MKDNLNIYISVLLGIIQGLTEFIPVSSTAHIRILPAFLNMSDVGTAYTAVIQLGSLVALLYYFKQDLYQFFKESIIALKNEFNRSKISDYDPIVFQKWNYQAKMPVYLLVGTFPIIIMGLLLKDFIKNQFRSLFVISYSLIIFALILWLADRYGKKNKSIQDINFKLALGIGFFQSLALIPGVSRSGITLTAGLLFGFTRESSMRYSFLLSIPAIALSGFYEFFQDWKELESLGWNSVFWGTFTSIIVSYGVIVSLLKYLRTHNTLIFVIYRIILGITILILIQKGILQP